MIKQSFKRPLRQYKNDIEKRAVKFGQAIEVLIEEIENSKEL